MCVYVWCAVCVLHLRELVDGSVALADRPANVGISDVLWGVAEAVATGAAEELTLAVATRDQPLCTVALLYTNNYVCVLSESCVFCMCPVCVYASLCVGVRAVCVVCVCVFVWCVCVCVVLLMRSMSASSTG